jgi:predicted small metal-binding protein
MRFPSTKENPVEREAQELCALWEEVGSRGLDIWFELPAGYAKPDGSGGEPGRGYGYSSLMEDYLATLAGEKGRGGRLVRWALLCGCRRHLEASDEEELLGELLAHLEREHPAMEHRKWQVRERVAAHSYRYEEE